MPVLDITSWPYKAQCQQMSGIAKPNYLQCQVLNSDRLMYSSTHVECSCFCVLNKYNYCYLILLTSLYMQTSLSQLILVIFSVHNQKRR